MDVLYFEVGKYPRVIQVKELEEMEQLVNGCIATSYPFEDPAVLVVNDDGFDLGLPFNRIVNPYPIVGNFFIAGIVDTDFASLPPALIKKFSEQFHYPEIPVRDPSARYGIFGITFSETMYAKITGLPPSNLPER